MYTSQNYMVVKETQITQLLELLPPSVAVEAKIERRNRFFCKNGGKFGILRRLKFVRKCRDLKGIKDGDISRAQEAAEKNSICKENPIILELRHQVFDRVVQDKPVCPRQPACGYHP